MKRLALLTALGLVALTGCADDDPYEAEEKQEAADATARELGDDTTMGGDDAYAPDDTAEDYGARPGAAYDPDSDVGDVADAERSTAAGGWRDGAADTNPTLAQPADAGTTTASIEIDEAKVSLDTLNDSVAEATLLLGRLQEADEADQSRLLAQLDSRIQAMNRALDELQQQTQHATASNRQADELPVN